jgi:alpha-D-xyloside xylohydrolase
MYFIPPRAKEMLMHRHFWHLPAIVLLLSATMAFARQDTVQLNIQGSQLDIQWFAPGIVHIQISPPAAHRRRTSLSVIAIPQNVLFKTRESDGFVVVSTDQVVLTINKRDGMLKFFDSEGVLLLSANGLNAETFEAVPDNGEQAYHVKQAFTLSEDEGIYGLGQFEDAIVNFRGRDILIAQANRTAVNPFLVSTAGYGILWDNYSRSRFSDGKEGTFFWSEIADGIDYYFVYGPTLDEVVAGYRQLTGRAPMLGKWAYGYWQSKERYKTAAELVDILREYRKRNIPIDNVVQDWSYWGGNDQFSGMVWDSSSYPDPATMVDTIHAYHGHLTVSIWPAFGPKTDIFREMQSKGLLYSVPHWNGGKVYDAFNPEAREIYWRYLKKGLFDIGVDGYWMDATEPEFRCTDDRYITELSMKSAERNYLGSFARYLNAYSLMSTAGVYEHLRRATETRRAFILTRSSFTGQQRYGAVTWSGDTFASWDDLKVQIAAGINFSMSGIPYWTHDIGGFITDIHFPRGLDDPAYKELYVRWFQFGAFCPIFRAHGTNIPREVWRFGNPGDWAYEALVAADRLRYRLMPYIYSIAAKVNQEDYSFIRGLPMDFPQDNAALSIGGQYLFGPSIMVCPVTRPTSHRPAFEGIDITPNHFFSPSGDEHGLQLQIYRGTQFDRLLLERKTDASQIGWSGCLPAELDTAYSLRMTGRVMSDARGRHTLYIISDGGVRLWIGNRPVIDEWSNTVSSMFSADVYFREREKVPLRLEYKQCRANSALLKINWKLPETAASDSTAVEVYLPRTVGWFDFWSGSSRRGGQQLPVEAPISRLPLFVRAGSIVPLGPEVQYASEPSTSPVEVRIYPGRNASFTLYDDDGTSYEYEKGAFTQIPFHWDDSAKALTIGDRVGEFSGAPHSRSFTIVVVKENHGAGIGITPDPDRTVEYDGKAMTILF